MVIASFTDISKNYEVTFKDGKAVDCSCPDRQYRRNACKHMSNAQGQLDSEIAKTEKFLALKACYEQPLYSEVCGHLVKSNIHRHCGCMA